MAELQDTTLITDANLVSYYRFNSGALTTDEKAANTLTNNNTVGEVAGKYGFSADQGASNTNKYFSQGNYGIAGNGDISVVMWVNLRTEIGAGTQYFFSHTSTTTADRYLNLSYQYNGGTRQLQIEAAGTNTAVNQTLGTGTWFHLAVTRNVGGNAAKLYVNGVEVASGAIGTTGNVTNTTTFGAGVAGGDVTSAIIDDLAVFNDVLSPTEVSLLATDIAVNPGYAIFV